MSSTKMMLSGMYFMGVTSARSRVVPISDTSACVQLFIESQNGREDSFSIFSSYETCHRISEKFPEARRAQLNLGPWPSFHHPNFVSATPERVRFDEFEIKLEYARA